MISASLLAWTTLLRVCNFTWKSSELSLLERIFVKIAGASDKRKSWLVPIEERSHEITVSRAATLALQTLKLLLSTSLLVHDAANDPCSAGDAAHPAARAALAAATAKVTAATRDWLRVLAAKRERAIGQGAIFKLRVASLVGGTSQRTAASWRDVCWPVPASWI